MNKTDFCNENCKREGYKMHDAICLYKRRDVGDLIKKVDELEKRIERLESSTLYCSGSPTV